MLGHGMSTAGAYLVTAHLPGYRCGSTLVGRPTPAGRLWRLGAALARTLAAIHWGCLLAHLAAGVHPFASRSEQEWILRVQSAQPDLYGLPPHLDDLVRWTLTRDPRHRPSAAELATICQRHDDGLPQPVPTTTARTSAYTTTLVPETVRVTGSPAGSGVR
jgi:serine/threonine protein kinase